jgi:hypothetical protein
MKIKVFELNQFNEEKGALYGVITYERMKLKVTPDNPELEEIVHTVYKSLLNGSAKKHYVKEMKVKIITPQFVEALGIACWKKGLMIEVEE